jgi:hypothetical protein
MLGMYLTISPNANLQAAELQVLTGGGMTAPLKELGAQFESASGHKLVFRFGTTPELIKLATSGDPFDLAVVPREVFKDAAAQSQLVAGPTTDIARWSRCCISLGRSEAPDIDLPEALKQTLLKAQSVATKPASAASSFAAVRASWNRRRDEGQDEGATGAGTGGSSGGKRRRRARSFPRQCADAARFGLTRRRSRRTAAGCSRISSSPRALPRRPIMQTRRKRSSPTWGVPPPPR